MAETESHLQRSIAQALARSSKTARAISLQAGLGKDFVRDILKGRKRSVSSESLASLASALGVSVETLSNTTQHTELLPDTVLKSTTFRRIVPLLGDLKRDAWLAAGGLEVMKEAQTFATYDSRYADLEQSARVQSDDSVDRIVPRGHTLVTVPPEDLGGVRVGNIVVVLRTRANGDAQRAAWQAVSVNGALMFTTACRRLGDDQEIVPSWPEGDIVKVELLGVMIGAYLEAPGMSGPVIKARS